MDTLRLIFWEVLELLLHGRWSVRSELESIHGDLREVLGWSERRQVDRVEDERDEWRERTALLERQLKEARMSVLRRRSRRLFRGGVSPEFQFGELLSAVVVGISHDCVHVSIDGRDWPVHLPDLSWGDIKHPSRVLPMGREVRVKVLSVPSDAQHPFLVL